ncbi:cupin domain-containing protein [Streptomyces sp. NPDC047097]|uniref:cupin domain-containing protein n=1 Tax=Streptomyces sp. NPDC047097 TaxID=3155260 RepID=UPI0033F4ECA1
MSYPIVVTTDGGTRIQGPTGMPMTVKLGGAQTAGAYSLIEYTHAPGTAGPPPHVHHHHEEAFHVVSGELSLEVDGRTVVLGPGDYALVPRGAVHRPYNAGAVPVDFFFLTSPAMDGFFVEMADLNAATGGAPPQELLVELGARWDAEFTGFGPGRGDGTGTVRMVNE